MSPKDLIENYEVGIFMSGDTEGNLGVVHIKEPHLLYDGEKFYDAGPPGGGGDEAEDDRNPHGNPV